MTLDRLLTRTGKLIPIVLFVGVVFEALSSPERRRQVPSSVLVVVAVIAGLYYTILLLSLLGVKRLYSPLARTFHRSLAAVFGLPTGLDIEMPVIQSRSPQEIQRLRFHWTINGEVIGDVLLACPVCGEIMMVGPDDNFSGVFSRADCERCRCDFVIPMSLERLSKVVRMQIWGSYHERGLLKCKRPGFPDPETEGSSEEVRESG